MFNISVWLLLEAQGLCAASFFPVRNSESRGPPVWLPVRPPVCPPVCRAGARRSAGIFSGLRAPQGSLAGPARLRGIISHGRQPLPEPLCDPCLNSFLIMNRSPALWPHSEPFYVHTPPHRTGWRPVSPACRDTWPAHSRQEAPEPEVNTEKSPGQSSLYVPRTSGLCDSGPCWVLSER